MANHQLHPLEVNPQTGEPFLRLRHHKNIILTPPRPADVAAYIPLINDPRVYDWLIGPPIPYLQEHSEAFYRIIKAPSDEALSELDAAQDGKDLITLRHCPIRALREVGDDGGDVYLGDIGLDRFTDKRVLAPPGLELSDEQKEKHAATNADRPVGDPDIIWTFGDYLSPSHHGQGIMSDAVETLLWDWAIPRMGVRRIIATAFEGNHGSVRVFEKNGFVLTRTLLNHAEARGRMRNLHVLEWDMASAKPPTSSK